jgi:DNA-binding YbaB/EbfC family protein
MQEDMAAKQEELDAREYDISAGGGVVGVKINGKKEILSIDIKPEIVDPDDIETLQDILVAAVNEAIKKVETTNSDEMAAITGNLNLGSMPGFF